MNNSVIMSSIEPRIGYYMSAAGITNKLEINEYRKKFQSNDITSAQILDCTRSLEYFNVAMGEKRTTAKMYLEHDITVLNNLFHNDKISGRNFVETMKQETKNNNSIEDNGNNISSSKTLTKVNSNSSSYKIFSNIS